MPGEMDASQSKCPPKRSSEFSRPTTLIKETQEEKRIYFTEEEAGVRTVKEKVPSE